MVCKAANIQKLSEVEQINLENECIQFLHNDYGNNNYLRRDRVKN